MDRFRGFKRRKQLNEKHKKIREETTETIRSGNNKEGLLISLFLKLRSNRQTYIVEAVWAAEVSPLKSAP